MNIMDMEYLMCRNSSGIQENSSATREFQVQINRYDGEGLRHEMEENGRLIKFLYNEDREVVAEETSNGTITRYIRGLGIISSDSEEAKTYYHYVSDEQGSITYVLSEDAEILNHYSYDAFGNIIEKTEKVENRFCYNGEMLDPVTQQYYLRARFYNPVIGRFTQEDTYYGDGLNLYQYCQANPVGYVDPSGHNICPTQLSLYKKYKEFFAKKMPEAEAKKKAYEYMRKKMGLTADNPFTETSKGGTKSAYNDSGVGKSKNPWKSYESGGSIVYGELDSLGRTTGIEATITPDMIGTGSTAKPSIKPAGFGGQAQGHARGHLLGNQLGGAGNDPRNLVTIYQNPVNHPVMSSIERSVRKTVEGGQIVNYKVTPIYQGNNLIPSGITIQAQGNGGLNIFQTILNRK